MGCASSSIIVVETTTSSGAASPNNEARFENPLISLTDECATVSFPQNRPPPALDNDERDSGTEYAYPTPGNSARSSVKSRRRQASNASNSMRSTPCGLDMDRVSQQLDDAIGHLQGRR
jgi:hypothetical protein